MVLASNCCACARSFVPQRTLVRNSVEHERFTRRTYRHESAAAQIERPKPRRRGIGLWIRPKLELPTVHVHTAQFKSNRTPPRFLRRRPSRCDGHHCARLTKISTRSAIHSISASDRWADSGSWRSDVETDGQREGTSLAGVGWDWVEIICPQSGTDAWSIRSLPHVETH